MSNWPAFSGQLPSGKRQRVRDSGSQSDVDKQRAFLERQALLGLSALGQSDGPSVSSSSSRRGSGQDANGLAAAAAAAAAGAHWAPEMMHHFLRMEQDMRNQQQLQQQMSGSGESRDSRGRGSFSDRASSSSSSTVANNNHHHHNNISNNSNSRNNSSGSMSLLKKGGSSTSSSQSFNNKGGALDLGHKGLRDKERSSMGNSRSSTSGASNAPVGGSTVSGGGTPLNLSMKKASSSSSSSSTPSGNSSHANRSSSSSHLHPHLQVPNLGGNSSQRVTPSPADQTFSNNLINLGLLSKGKKQQQQQQQSGRSSSQGVRDREAAQAAAVAAAAAAGIPLSVLQGAGTEDFQAVLLQQLAAGMQLAQMQQQANIAVQQQQQQQQQAQRESHSRSSSSSRTGREQQPTSSHQNDNNSINTNNNVNSNNSSTNNHHSRNSLTPNSNHPSGSTGPRKRGRPPLMSPPPSVGDQLQMKGTGGGVNHNNFLSKEVSGLGNEAMALLNSRLQASVMSHPLLAGMFQAAMVQAAQAQAQASGNPFPFATQIGNHSGPSEGNGSVTGSTSQSSRGNGSSNQSSANKKAQAAAAAANNQHQQLLLQQQQLMLQQQLMTQQQMLSQQQQLQQGQGQGASGIKSNSDALAAAGIVVATDDDDSDDEEINPNVREEDIRLPIKMGWRRYTIITKFTSNGVKGSTVYISPEGKKLRTLNDIQKYVNKNNLNKKISKDNFSFSGRWIVGEFNLPSDYNMSHTMLSESEVINRVDEYKKQKRKRMGPVKGSNKKIALSSGTSGPFPSKKGDHLTSNNTPSTASVRSQQQQQAKLKEQQLRERDRDRDFEPLDPSILVLAQSFPELQEIMKNSGTNSLPTKLVTMLKNVLTQQKVEQEAQKKREEESRKEQLALAQKKREAQKAAEEEEAAAAREQEMIRRKEQQQLHDLEKERRRQHMMIVKQLDTYKRMEERERKRDEMLADRKMAQEKRITKKRLEVHLMNEVRKPIDDMRLKTLVPLPSLNRIPGLKLPGKAFSDVLMVYEFLNNFGEALGFDMESLPSLNSFQLALLNMDETAEEELMSVLQHLLVCAIEDPSIPVPVTTSCSQKLKDAPINSHNMSEMLRLYFWSFCQSRKSAMEGPEGKIYRSLSRNKPYLSLPPTMKAEVLAYLCNELLINQTIVKQIEDNIDSVASLRKDKWVVDCDLRKFKTIQMKRQRKAEMATAQEEAAAKRTSAIMTESTNSTATTMMDVDGPGSEGNDSKLKLDDSLVGVLNTSVAEFHESDPEHHEDGVLHMPVQLLSDEEPEMSNEEIDKKVDKLGRNCTLVTNKLNKAIHGLRVSSLGQDRYRRRYWVLPACGGVFVEGMSSGEPEMLLQEQISAEDSSIDSCEMESQEDNKENEELRVKEEKVMPPSEITQIPITIPTTPIVPVPSLAVSPVVSVEPQVPLPDIKCEKRDEDDTKIPVDKEGNATSTPQLCDPKLEVPIGAPEMTTPPEDQESSGPDLQNGDNKETEPSATNAVTDGEPKLETDVVVSSESTVIDEQKDAMISPLVASAVFRADVVPISEQSNIVTPNNTMTMTMTMTTNNTTMTMVSSRYFMLSTDGNKVIKLTNRPFFPLFPRTACLPPTPVPISEYEGDEEIEGFHDPWYVTLPEASPMQIKADKVARVIVGLSNGSMELSTLPPLDDLGMDMVCPTIINKIQQQLLEQTQEPVKIPMENCLGWWRVMDAAQLRNIVEGLHERGARERNLVKHIQKYMTYITTKIKNNAAEFDVTELDRKIFEECSYGAPTDSGRYSKKVAMRLDRMVIDEIEVMQEKISNSSMQVRGWKSPAKKSSLPDSSFKRSLVKLPIKKVKDEEENGDDNEDEDEEGTKRKEEEEEEEEEKMEVEEKVESEDDEDLEENEEEEEDEEEHDEDAMDILEVGKDLLLSTEAIIERRYLKPPLGFKSNTILVSAGVDELAENFSDDNAPSGLVRWRESVRECTTTSQLALLLNFLESCIAWDKSIMRASCQFCCSGEHEEQLLLCDGCDKGYHMYCFKPKMEEVPDGDWFCFECQNKNTIDKVCIVCGKKGKLLNCDTCPKVFHPNCIDPPGFKPPKGKWACHFCVRKPKKLTKAATQKKGGQVDEKGAKDVTPVTTPAKETTSKRTSTAKGKKGAAAAAAAAIAAAAAAASVTSSPEKDASDKGVETPKSDKKGKGKKEPKYKKKKKTNANTGKGGTPVVADSPASNDLNHKSTSADQVTSTTTSTSALVAGTDGTSGAPIPGSSTSEDASQLAQCQELLIQMEGHEDSWPFQTPVNTKQFPTYKKIIKKPMDTQTMKQKLISGSYKDKDDFYADIILIFNNCVTFNEDESPVGRAGHNLRTFFDKRWKELFG